MIGRIYLIRNSVNGKGYVGQTIYSIAHRWSAHKNEAKGESLCALHCAIRKYGIEKFFVSEVAQCDLALMNDLEKYFIEFYGTFHSQHGYNLTVGGEGALGYKHTLENIEKIRILHTGNAYRKGIKNSFETRAKISAAHIGRKQSPEWIEKRIAPLRGKFRPVHVIEALRLANTGRKRSDEQKIANANRRRGTKSSDETRAKVSASLMGNTRSIGRKHSEETKQKMSVAHKGKPAPTKGKPWSKKRRNAATLRQFPGGLTQ